MTVWAAPLYSANGCSVTTAMQEDQGQAGEQDVQRDLVRCLLPRRALRRARSSGRGRSRPGCGRDLDRDLVRQHTGPAGDRGPVATRLANDRRRFTGDGRLVDAGDALDDGRRRRGSPRPPPRPPRRPPAGPSSRSSANDPSAARRWATVSWRAARSVSACALPRPSATASAKLANSTVTTTTRPPARRTRSRSVIAEPRSVKNRIVVSTLPISTTNMTGLRAMSRGSSLRTLSPQRACARSPGRTAIARADDCAPWRPAIRAAARTGGTGSGVLFHGRFVAHSDNCSAIGPSASTGKNVRPTTSTITPVRSTDEQRRVGRERARCRPVRAASSPVNRRSRARGRSAGTGRSTCTRPSVVLYQSVLPVRPPNAEPLLFGGRGERVRDLGEAVRAGVEDRRLGRCRAAPTPRLNAEDHHGDGEDVEHDELHLARLDLLAQVLGCAPDHESGDEHRERARTRGCRRARHPRRRDSPRPA